MDVSLWVGVGGMDVSLWVAVGGMDVSLWVGVGGMDVSLWVGVGGMAVPLWVGVGVQDACMNGHIRADQFEHVCFTLVRAAWLCDYGESDTYTHSR